MFRIFKNKHLLKKALVALAVVVVMFCSSGDLTSHMSMKMSQGENCPTCQNVHGEVFGVIVSQDLLRSAVIAFGGLLLVWLFSRKHFRESLLALQHWLLRPPNRTETSVFFDTGFRQLRQFQIFANAVPDPQVFSV